MDMHRNSAQDICCCQDSLWMTGTLWKQERLAYCSYLQAVLKHATGPDSNSQAFQSSHDSLDDMRRRLKHVWPNVVQEVVEGIFAAEAVHTQRHVLNHSTGRLSVDQVPVRSHKQQVNIVAAQLVMCSSYMQRNYHTVQETNERHQGLGIWTRGFTHTPSTHNWWIKNTSTIRYFWRNTHL